MARPSPLALVAATTLTLAAPVATWWIVGDQSTTTVSPDYVLRPFSISAGTERAAGVAAVAAVILAAVGLWLAVRHRSVDRRWLLVLSPLLATGAICGAGWRAMTAGVIGANISAGLTLMLGGPISLALVVFGAWEVRLIVRSPGSAHASQ